MALTKEEERMFDVLMLQKEELKNLLKDNNLSSEDVLSPRQKKAIVRAQSVLNTCNKRRGFAKLVSIKGNLSIKKGAFVRAAKKEFSRLITEGNFFINLNTDVAGTHTVDVPAFIKLIAPISVKTPIAEAALKSFIANPTKMATVQEVESLFSSILNLLYAPKWLRSHYDSNKTTYLKKVKNVTEENATEAVFKSDIATDFANLIKTIGVHLLSSINDPSYGPNREKIEAAEREAKQLRKEFDIAYQQWLNQSIDNVTNLDSSISEKVLPKDIFTVSVNDWRPLWASAQPELTNRLLNNALGVLTKTNVSVAECAEAINTALQENYTITIGADLMFENWKVNRNLPNINGLISTIQMVAGDDAQNEFNKVYISWYKDQFDALDSLEWNNNDRFYKKKVLTNLTQLLQGDDRAFMLPIFKKYFDNLSNIARIEDYIQEWKRGMNDVIDIVNLKKQYELKKLKYSDIDDLLNSINLPSEDEIHRLFDREGKYIHIKPKPANGEVVPLKIQLNDGTLLIVHVPTNIEMAGNKAFATPTDVVLAGQNSGALGYKFSISGVALENTSAYEQQGLWITPFDFRINFEKKAGELSGGYSHSDGTTTSSGTSETTTHGEETDITYQVGGATTSYGEFSMNESVTVEGDLLIVGGEATLGSEQTVGFSQEVNYGVERGSEVYDETSTTNSFETGTNSTDTYSSGETVDKGMISGSFGFQFSLASQYIEPAQEGNNATIEAKLSIDQAPYPLSSKGCSITGISPGIKTMPATKK